MSRQPFAQLPDHARLWVFAADRPLTPPEQQRVTAAVEEGLAAWAAHGSPVTWGYELRENQFLLLGADETHTALTGCSIDNAVHRIQKLERELNLSLTDHGRVFFVDQGRVRCVNRAAFRELAEAKAVGADTVVYNNIVATVGEARRGAWKVPLADSWHAKAFPVGA